MNKPPSPLTLPSLRSGTGFSQHKLGEGKPVFFRRGEGEKKEKK